MTDPIPTGFQTLTPHITVKDSSAAIELYTRAFGAVEIARHAIDGRVMHALIKIGDSFLMLNDEFPAQGVLSPPEQGAGVRLHLYLEDVDVAFGQAVKAGLEVIMPVMDMFWGDRYAIVKDSFGHQWSLASHIEDLTPDEVVERGKKAMAGMG